MSQDKDESAPVKVLFLAANPAMTTRLALDVEMREIEQKVRASKYRDALVFQLAWAVRPDDLLQLFNQHQPQIVHFSGHGSEQGLRFASEDGDVRLVATPVLKQLFAVCKGTVRLVFLNACSSQAQAQALLETVDCVIGMKEAIHDVTAATFASSFYSAIGFGQSVQTAFEQGIVALRLNGSTEAHVPELLVKEGIDAKTVVLIAPGPPLLSVWMVPSRRNTYFTGREDVLTHIHARFTSDRAAVLTQGQAINGLGGIGKTQIAVEYVY